MKHLIKHISFIIAIGVLILSSCTKNKIEIPESNDPIFKLEGAFGGEAISLVAGDNNAFMHTMTYMENGVNLYSGQITDGNLSVKIGVYDGFLDFPVNEAIEEIASSTPIFAINSSVALAELSKNDFSNSSSINEIEWFINDQFAGINDVQITEPGLYNVCAVITFMDSSVDSLCNDMIVGYERTANCSIDYSVDQSGYLNAGIDNMGYGVAQIKWFQNDILISTGTNLQMNLPSVMTNIKAEVHFSNGVVRTKSILVNGAYPNHAIDDFTMFEISMPIVLQQDFNVKVEIMDNGITYYSVLSDNTGSTINITNIEFYGKNSANQDVYKITANVSAYVKPTTGFIDTPVSFTTTFGIEVP